MGLRRGFALDTLLNRHGMGPGVREQKDINSYFVSDRK